jgi:hypothetical protein
MAPPMPCSPESGPLGDDLGNEVRFAAPPQPEPEEQGEGAREASLGARQKRVGAAAHVRCIGAWNGRFQLEM